MSVPLDGYKSEVDKIICEHFYGQARNLQNALGVTRAAISVWRTRGIPAMRRYHIDAVIAKRMAELKK